MTETMQAFTAWAHENEDARRVNFRSYVHSIAQARYVVRRVLRIVDEQARALGLEPLQHQALLQIYGAMEEELPVNRVAERLDIAPAFASRLIRELESRGFVTRSSSPADRRLVSVAATEAGVEALKQIDNAVHVHVEYFQRQLTDADRLSALAIFGFYVGLAPGSRLAREIRKGVQETRRAADAVAASSS